MKIYDYMILIWSAGFGITPFIRDTQFYSQNYSLFLPPNIPIYLNIRSFTTPTASCPSISMPYQPCWCQSQAQASLSYLLGLVGVISCSYGSTVNKIRSKSRCVRQEPCLFLQEVVFYNSHLMGSCLLVSVVKLPSSLIILLILQSPLQSPISLP